MSNIQRGLIFLVNQDPFSRRKFFDVFISRRFDGDLTQKNLCEICALICVKSV